MPLRYSHGDFTHDELGSALKIASGVFLIPGLAILLGLDPWAFSFGQLWGFLLLALIMVPAFVTSRLLAPILEQLVSTPKLIAIFGLVGVFLASRVLPSAFPLFETVGRGAAIAAFAGIAWLCWQAARAPHKIEDARLTASSYFVWTHK